VVTGAARGIGAAVARLSREAGAAVTALDVERGDELTRCDVTDERAVASTFAQAARAAPITDVIHAAGTVSLGAVAETSLADFRKTVEVNLFGAFIVAREAARRLPRGGHLVFIASQAALKGGALWGAYAASKAGILRLADCLVEELAERGVRVNSISPGNVDTEMAAQAITALARYGGETPESVRARYEQQIPLKRFAEPDEIGCAVVALCSNLLSYVNGANLIIDGGELSR